MKKHTIKQMNRATMRTSVKSQEAFGKPGLAEIFAALSGIAGLGVTAWKTKMPCSDELKDLGHQAVMLALNTKKPVMLHIARKGESAVKGIMSPSKNKAPYKSIDTVEGLQQELAKKALLFLEKSMGVLTECSDVRVSSPYVIAKGGKFIPSLKFGGTASDVCDHIQQMLTREKTSSLARPLVEFTFANTVVDPHNAPYLPVMEKKKQQRPLSESGQVGKPNGINADQPAFM